MIFLPSATDDVSGGSNMAKKPQVAAAATTESAAATVNPFAGRARQSGWKLSDNQDGKGRWGGWRAGGRA
jgi:hypothetical protein